VATSSSQLGAHDSPSHLHLFGFRDTEDFVSSNRRIVLLSTVASGDKEILLMVGNHKPVDPKAVIRFN
jgi:hypothetical protein